MCQETVAVKLPASVQLNKLKLLQPGSMPLSSVAAQCRRLLCKKMMSSSAQQRFRLVLRRKLTSSVAHLRIGKAAVRQPRRPPQQPPVQPPQPPPPVPLKSALRAPQPRRRKDANAASKSIAWCATGVQLVHRYKSETLALTQPAPREGGIECDDCGERLPMGLTLCVSKLPVIIRCVHCISCRTTNEAPAGGLLPEGADSDWRLQYDQGKLMYMHQDGRRQSWPYMGCPNSVSAVVRDFQRRLEWKQFLLCPTA
eukprot:TRINITY_DN5985_c1_g1_i2.p1 TRINITY_DN5985_c1_g1~~TRINITY_DN5985_c1_g1_i2.p1  ORF type:complete len:255 (+),score=38.19 TRINITY_DN5985_c1_g1_i2:233-997(+)